MNTLYLCEDYDVDTGYNDEPSDEPYDGYSHEIRENHKYWYEEVNNFSYGVNKFEADKTQPIYLLYVLYSSGGTFGRTDGYSEIIGVGNDYDELNKIYEEIESGKYEKSGNYCPWVGYFERFGSVNLIEIKKERHSGK